MVTCASAPLRERVLVVLSYNDGPNRLVLSILDRLERFLAVRGANVRGVVRRIRAGTYDMVL